MSTTFKRTGFYWKAKPALNIGFKYSLHFALHVLFNHENSLINRKFNFISNVSYQIRIVTEKSIRTHKHIRISFRDYQNILTNETACTSMQWDLITDVKRIFIWLPLSPSLIAKGNKGLLSFYHQNILCMYAFIYNNNRIFGINLENICKSSTI